MGFLRVSVGSVRRLIGGVDLNRHRVVEHLFVVLF